MQGEPPQHPARPVEDVVADRTPRELTGLAEFDRVLGGGLVAGQVVLLAGEPGVGKSTLVAAVAHTMALRNETANVLYVSGEESVEQISVRARRTGAVAPGILLAEETDLGALIGHVEAHDPVLLIVDSVQAIASSSVDGRAGGMSQVQEVTSVLVRLAKSRRLPLLLIGQSTRENAVAGPRALEHMVDTVLTFEGDKHTALRMLRAVKNRYGPSDEVVCFEQADDGLREVPDPSSLFRSARDEPVPGTAVAVSVDGRRAVPAEVQALVAATASGNPRRGVTGLDTSRVAMLLAVTEREAEPQARPRRLRRDGGRRPAQRSRHRPRRVPGRRVGRLDDPDARRRRRHRRGGAVRRHPPGQPRRPAGQRGGARRLRPHPRAARLDGPPHRRPAGRRGGRAGAPVAGVRQPGRPGPGGRRRG